MKLWDLTVEDWTGVPIVTSRLVPEDEIIVMGTPPVRIVTAPIGLAKLQFRVALSAAFDDAVRRIDVLEKGLRLRLSVLERRMAALRASVGWQP